MHGIRISPRQAALLCFLSLVWLGGCSSDESRAASDQAFISSGDVVLTAQEFEEELELKRSAYPYDIGQDPESFNRLVVQLVAELSEETLLRRAAGENGISVSADEVSISENRIRAEYPDDTFEKMLLRNAVSYSFWKRKLERRLVMDRLIDTLVVKPIEITPSDIRQYVAARDMESGTKEGDSRDDSIDEETLVARVRSIKAESAYETWIADLSKSYPVTIRQDKLRSYLKDTSDNNTGGAGE